jgi:hypothetical protein
MGLGASISLTVEAIVVWQLSTLAKTNASQLRPIMAVFLLGYLALSVNSYAYFFPPPVVGELLIVACLGAAILTSKPNAAQVSR